VEGRPPDDALLVRRARRGDADAYECLLLAHEDRARRVAAVLCGADGDDAVQEAFVKAWIHIGTFQGDGPFAAWLLRIVANEARNRRRAAGRRAGYELRVVEDRASGAAAPSPESAVLDAERRRATVAAVTALPPHLNEVVSCRYLLGMTEAETAAVLGLPAGTVKSRLSRALDRLRAELPERPSTWCAP
jgi:RNA polymerase sigma-70 factor (ECF subfamily)